MAVQATDLLLIQRGSTLYKAPASDLPPSGANVVVLTQAAYDALSPPDPNTIYFIQG